MVVYGKKLVVLPFRRDSSLDEIELQDVKPMKKTPVQLIAKTPILASYIITLKDLDEKIDNVGTEKKSYRSTPLLKFLVLPVD